MANKILQRKQRGKKSDNGGIQEGVLVILDKNKKAANKEQLLKLGFSEQTINHILKLEEPSEDDAIVTIEDE